MKITLKNLRENKKWSLKLASEIYKIDINTLKNFEEYKEIPNEKQVDEILRKLNKNYMEFFCKIYEDIYDNFLFKN